jgi:MFS family permease
MVKQQSRTGGVFYGWWIVAVSMIGISTCPQPFVVGSMGLFMKPFAEEFGWSRSEISACITVLTVAFAVCFPLIGRLIDRFGAKKILLPSMLFLALLLSSISLFVTEIWHLLIVFLLIGILAAGTNTVSYVPVISAWFDRNRGLAIGLSISGIGLGFIYVPLLVQFLIDAYGWRSAYYGLSAVIVLIAMPLIALFMKETPAAMNLTVDGDTDRELSDSYFKLGLETAETIRKKEFWMLMVTFIFVSFVVHGLLTHLVPMITDRGTSASYAAAVASTMGITIFISRIGVGYLVDRFFAPTVAVYIFGLSALGLLSFALGASGQIALVSAIFIGLSLGAEVDLMAYLASRYFGLRSFASIYGILLSGIVVGAGAAPVSFALWFDISGSYTGVLLISVVLNLIAVILMAWLKPYPKWEQAAA